MADIWTGEACDWLAAAHRPGVREQVLTAQVGAGERSDHRDQEVKHGRHHRLHRPHWRGGRRRRK